ncbi:putative membrane protein DUF2157 [Pseudonocardia hierapolitana]|uniref:Putative membrane protein DUF2157 n=1 Tax=Pseudonocardia hierapolitana TaxID=1128676 RepID=A0A561SYW4_9PSEU|nr:DUF2157 domain-containing protein [Pseudonocardia hierapolitana]TWF80023.1 putative membrane protein DUF2157 [Pseudonocardia hierapolitana]
MTSPASDSDGPDLAAGVRRWVDSGLITSDQAERILAAESIPAGRPAVASRASMVAEALGYVGAVLVLVGAVTVADRYWSQIGVGGRLGIAFGAAALLLATGAAVPARRADVGRRLRGVCWLLSAALFGTGLALLGDEVLQLRGESIALLAAAGTAAYAAVLWWRHRGVLQQAALLAALAVAAGAAAAHLPADDDAVTGLAVWGVGAGWAVLGWGRVIAARNVAYALGGTALVVGSQFAVETGWGAVLAVGSVIALVTAGAWLRELVLLGVGAVGTFLTVPAVVGQYFPDTLAVPLALVGCGLLLVAGAAYTARLRRTAATRRRQAEGTRTAALTVAAVIAVAVTVAVLVMGS